jgi:hypothetical protein
MSEWPAEDDVAVYSPEPMLSPRLSDAEVRAELAAARLAEGLPVSDAILSSVLRYRQECGFDSTLTAVEDEDTFGDRDRVARAEGVLAGADDVLGGIEVCWVNDRRAVRVRLTDRLEHYRRALLQVLEPDRLVMARARFTARELAEFSDQVHAQADELSKQNIFLSSWGTGVDGLKIDYFAPDHAEAERSLNKRFGQFSTITYLGASRETICAHPFGSWLSEGRLLHVFYALARNGEQPGDCTVHETQAAIVVALTIVDWLGAKTLVGGFTPAYATATLKAPLAGRRVIDVAHNRSRPHWTQARRKARHTAAD